MTETIFATRPPLELAVEAMARNKAFKILSGEDAWGERHSRLYAATIRDLLAALGLSERYAEAMGNELAGRVSEHLRIFRSANVAVGRAVLQ